MDPTTTTGCCSTNEREIEDLRRQRNRFGVVAVFAVASIGFAFPHKLASYRELKAVNERTVDVQAMIVQEQSQLIAVQAQILQVQNQIRKKMSQ